MGVYASLSICVSVHVWLDQKSHQKKYWNCQMFFVLLSKQWLHIFLACRTCNPRISSIHDILNNVLYNMHYDATGNWLRYILIDFDNYLNSFTTGLQFVYKLYSHVSMHSTDITKTLPCFTWLCNLPLHGYTNIKPLKIMRVILDNRGILDNFRGGIPVEFQPISTENIVVIQEF